MNTISKTFWRKARFAVSGGLAAAFVLVAVLTMGTGPFRSSGNVLADTPIIFTGGGEFGGIGQALGLDKHCDKHAAEAAKHDAEAAKFAARNGKQSDEQAAKKANEAAKELQKFHDCLAKLVVASILGASDPQAQAAAVGLDLNAIGVTSDSTGTLAWESIKWNSIKWNAVQLDSINWDSIKWNGGAGDLALQ